MTSVDEADRERQARVLEQASNPFNSAPAIDHSNYCYFDGKRLVRQGAGGFGARATGPGREPSRLTAFIHDGFRALTLNEHFPCVGAKAAVRQGGYGFGLYGELASPASCDGLSRDLFTFSRDRARLASEFHTFVASFAGPLPTDEASFEHLLWNTLQRLHELDSVHHRWDPAVAADPENAHFSFSFAERAFFVVGLHAASSRATRRFAWPTLIFNPHDQFERLKATGRYQRFKDVIRVAERQLQGDTNPMLTDFGDRSEAAQYSGRQVESDWRCPFQAKLVGADQEEMDSGST